MLPPTMRVRERMYVRERMQVRACEADSHVLSFLLSTSTIRLLQ